MMMMNHADENKLSSHADYIQSGRSGEKGLWSQTHQTPLCQSRAIRRKSFDPISIAPASRKGGENGRGEGIQMALTRLDKTRR